MFETIEEIKAVIKEKEDLLSDLRDRMDEYFDLFTLAEYQAKDAQGNVRAGYEAYTSTAPRNFFDKVLDGVNRSALTIAIKLPEKATKKQQKAASEGELFLFGALAEIDRQRAKRGEPPLREALGFFGCLRGRVALRALVYTPTGGDGDVVPDAQPWDPMHVTWEMGSNGLVWIAYKRKATKAQILSEYGITLSGDAKDAEVIDFFGEEINAVIVGDEWAKEPTPHDRGRVPGFVGAVGSMPTLQTKDFESTIEYQGNSVWSVARKVPEARNKYISRLMDIQRRSVAGSLVHKKPDGVGDIEGDPYESFKIVPLGPDETLEPLELPQAPPETAAIMGFLEGDWQQSTLPYPIAYGGTRQAQSGISLSIQLEATRSVYNPFTAIMVRVYTWLCEELLSQFKNKGAKEREFTGYDQDGKFFRTTIKPTAIDPAWFVEVKCEPRMPRDEEKEIMMANAARQPGPGGMPIVSDEFILENILKIRDPHAEIDKVMVQMAETLPPIRLRLIAKKCRERGRDDLAQEVEALLGPQGAPGPTQGPAGGQVGGQAGAPPPIPPDLARAILEVLTAAGQQDIAAAFVAVMEGRAPLTPELLEAIVQALVASGQPQLAEALLTALGIAPGGGGPGPGPETPGGPAAVPPVA